MVVLYLRVGSFQINLKKQAEACYDSLNCFSSHAGQFSETRPVGTDIIAEITEQFIDMFLDIVMDTVSV